MSGELCASVEKFALAKVAPIGGEWSRWGEFEKRGTHLEKSSCHKSILLMPRPATNEKADVLQECKPLTSLPHEVNGSPTRLGDRGEAANPS